MVGFVKRYLSYSNVVATFAMFVVLGGGAYAASKITSKDIQDNTIKSKDIKDGKGVTEADMAAEEPFHIVGDTGEPTFNTGGESDCIWTSASESQLPGINPVGFRIDRFGSVHLVGVPIATETPAAGDEECGATSPEPDDTLEDGIIFTLPVGYRPENAEVRLGNFQGALLINGDDPLVIPPSNVVPPGAVLASGSITDGGGWLLDGIQFPAASSGLFPEVSSSSDRPARISKELKKTLGL